MKADGLTIDSTMGVRERSKSRKWDVEGFMLVLWKVAEEGRGGEGRRSE
jgi:hypothetical protein